MALQWMLYSLCLVVLVYCAFSIYKRRATGRAAPWQRSGWWKGMGIPAPTGSCEVGCVDLMHRLEGDRDCLLVRLFYPTDPGLSGRYQYAKTTPDTHYLKASLRYMRVPRSGLVASILNPFVGQ